MIPKPAEVRSKLPQETLERSTIIALAISFLPFLCYCGTFLAIPLVQPLWAKLLLAAFNALAIAVLFVIGHDACHGSFTSRRWLNNLLGRLAFLPSLHPYTSWDLGHNRLHHCWTNLRGKDYVWTPLSWQEYRNAAPLRRLLERFYRSPLGVGAYYLVEIWWRHMVFPRKADTAKIGRALSLFDRFSVYSFFLAQVAVLFSIAASRSTGILSTLLIGVLVPQLLWNWLIGFVVFLHHTHPRVTWYDDQADWSFFAGQVQGTVHVIFPWPIGYIIHNIMEHTAHHIDPKIPLYNLPSSQRAVCETYPEHVIQSRFTLTHFLWIMGRCQLYDYTSRQWLDFSGRPTEATSTSANALAEDAGVLLSA